MGKVAFGVPFFNDTVVNGVTERRGIIAGIDEINGMAARDEKVYKRGVT
jgi:hypothetical protein